MPRKALMARDPERGERFVEIRRLLFPGLKRPGVAEKLGGISAGTVRNLEAGQGVSQPVLSSLEKMGVSLDYLLRGVGPPLLKPAREPAPAADLSSVEALAANLRHIRKERFRGWGGQKRFAEFLGISPNDLCVYEYGRALPNEQRLEDMAERLELEPAALLRLLPGVGPSSPASRAVADIAENRPAERGAREEDLLREAARLEAMNEILQRQLSERESRIRELEEANLALRSVIYMEDTPEGAERRRKFLEKIELSVAGLIGERGIF